MLNIRTGGHKELEKYYSLMEMDFDKKELLPKLSIHKGMLDKSQELLIIYDDETKMELAYALVFTKSMYGYVLLKYIGVLPWYREHGVGVDAMRLINKRYADRQGIIAELSAFDDEDGSYIKKLRKFFSRFGFVQVKANYRLGGQEVELMVKPIKGTHEISPVSHRIINDFYSRCLSAHNMGKMIDIRPIRD